MARKVISPESKVISKKTYQPPKEISSEHKELMMKIGKKLQELRKGKNLSSSGLAKELSISRNAYRHMETGKVYFNFLSLLQILAYHNLTAKKFFKEL
ncbi:MAG: helix-turn-helix transcriptional regulator [Bacteroidales bacterium]